MSTLDTRIADNVTEVRSRVAEAAARSGRTADDIRIVAVTKYVGEAEVRSLLAAGCRELGESRPQELWRKAEAIEGDVCWHLVGHLQRNKVRRTLPLVQWIHSADSRRLLEELNDQAAAISCRPNVLVEVNVSGDEAKHGFQPDALEPLLPRLAELDNLAIRGLMCMAALDGDLGVARRNFAELRELRDRLRSVAPESVALDELSMGMSGDYEVAIEEGATIVRVGSAFFAGTR